MKKRTGERKKGNGRSGKKMSELGFFRLNDFRIFFIPEGLLDCAMGKGKSYADKLMGSFVRLRRRREKPLSEPLIKLI